MTYELTRAAELAAVQTALGLKDLKSGIVATVAMTGTPEAAFATYVCDGVGDQVEINNAILAAHSAGGGIVRIFSGQFDIAASISASNTSNVTIEGVGYATHLMLHASTSQNIIAAQSPTKLVIRNLRLDGNRSNNSDPGGSQDAQQNNIAAWNASGLEIYGVYSHSAIYHGIFVRDATGASSNISIHDNELYDNGYRPVHIHGSDTLSIKYAIISRNLCHDNGALSSSGNAGIFCTFGNGHCIIVADNIIHDENGGGISVQGTLTSSSLTTAADKSIVTGNQIDNCKSAGIFIGEGTSRLIVSDNIVNGTAQLSGAAGSGILLYSVLSASTLSDITITGNQIIGSADRGIFATGSNTSLQGLVINENVLSGSGVHGVEIAVGGTVAGAEISSNVIHDNANKAIVVTETFPATAAQRPGVLVDKNKCFNNKQGIALTGIVHSTVSGNLVHDNVDNAGGNTNTQQLVMSGCVNCSIANNHIGNISRTNTGAMMVLDSTCTDLEVFANELFGGGTGISCAGTRIYTRGNYGTNDIKHTATSVDCVSIDDHSTNATPYTDQGGTRPKRRRLLSTSTAPTSAGTAGIIGDEILDSSGDLYRCTVSGSAGSATWKKLTSAASV